MRRLFWLALGVTVGVMVMRKLSRAAERMTPASLGHSMSSGLSDLAQALRDFSADVREAMHEQEVALRANAGLDGTLGAVPEPRQGEPQPPQAQIETA